RRAFGLRHPAYRHAGNAASGVAGDARGEPRRRGAIGNARITMTQAVELPLLSARASETRLVGSVCFAHFVSHVYIMLLAPVFMFVREDFSVSYTELGLALTAFSLTSTLFQTPAGFLVDRMSPRLVLIAGLLVSASAFAIAGLVD